MLFTGDMTRKKPNPLTGFPNFGRTNLHRRILTDKEEEVSFIT